MKSAISFLENLKGRNGLYHFSKFLKFLCDIVKYTYYEKN